jgi:transcriptional regulator with XRE-family HTH domain
MAEPINQQIAARVRQLRVEQGVSLDALAERCGVSRSMISLIERAEASPTAALLEKLAGGLNTTLAALFERAGATPGPVSRHGDQPVWRDPASGYLRRNVSRAGGMSPIQIVEVEFPPGAHVAYESGARQPVIHHQVWLLEGAMEVTVGDEQYALSAGDCLAFVLNRPTAYRNTGRKAARYAVIITSEPTRMR